MFCVAPKSLNAVDTILAFVSKGLAVVQSVMDRVDWDELGVRSRIEDEIKRFNKFRTGVLGHKQEKTSIDVDARNYAKYLLKEEGALIEKSELLSCLKSKLMLKDKKISLA